MAMPTVSPHHHHTLLSPSPAQHLKYHNIPHPSFVVGNSVPSCRLPPAQHIALGRIIFRSKVPAVRAQALDMTQTDRADADCLSAEETEREGIPRAHNGRHSPFQVSSVHASAFDQLQSDRADANYPPERTHKEENSPVQVATALPHISTCTQNLGAHLERDQTQNSVSHCFQYGRLLMQRRKDNEGLLKVIAGVASRTKERIISAIVDSLFKPAGDVNVQFEGNFGPVPEIGGRVPAQVIEGSIPADFPVGVYIRNGPNPQFGSDCMVSQFGKIEFHWFEGDGMVHATYFGPGGQVTYQNKFVETEGYKLERERKKRLWLNTAEGDPQAVAMGYFFNQLRFGKVNKVTCNTSVIQHAGRVLVGTEADLPYEIDPSDLSTIGVWDWNGSWDRPFTAHPKIVRDTNEMVGFGFAAVKPYYVIALVSADGQKVIHKCDIGLEKCIFSHDISITKQYNLILDWPLIIDVDRLKRGGNLMNFEGDTIARVGIMPRYGDAKTIRWFNVEMNYTFHIINSYEEGDEVVLHGCRARVSFLPAKEGMDRLEWFSRAVTPNGIEDANDSSIDGALVTHAHEWRFNMKTGDVVEKDLTDDSFSMEMPKINENFVGYKHKYAYADVVDIEASKKVGMPKYGKLVKLHLQDMILGESVKKEFYDPGPNTYLSEPLFVPRPHSIDEDDGWIVTYVHDETSNISQVHILDSKNFSAKPLAKIHLPQRVPYGFHSTFVHGVK